MTTLPAPGRAAGVELLGELAGSGYRQAPGLVRRADGQAISLTPLLHLTLRALDGRRTPEEVARYLTARMDRAVSADDVRYLVEHRLEPLGLVGDPGPVQRRANPLLALRLRLVVSNPRVTNRLARAFAWLFQPWLVLPALVAFGWLSWWLLTEEGLAAGARQAIYEPHLILVLWGVLVASSGFHELGHAAACRYGGARPGAMGAGLYLVWPAFYTDVTDSYRLSRRGRLLVDLGGLYFNALFALGVWVAWWMTGTDALLVGVLAQHLQMVRQLAPVIRADGYHLLADLTGVPDLFAQIKPTLLALVPWRRKRTTSTLKPWARALVSIWVLTVVPVLLWLLGMAVVLLPTLAGTAWDSSGLQADAAGEAWDRGDVAAALVHLGSVLLAALPVVAIGYLLVRIGRRLARVLWAASARNRTARAFVVVGGCAVSVLLAWAWWPSGQYEPLTVDDRGAVTDLAGEGQSAVHRSSPPPSSPDQGGAAAAGSSATAMGPLAPGDVVRVLVADSSSEPGVQPTAQPEPVAVEVIRADGERWVFPFPRPAPPEAGDNRSSAVNTTDGSTLTDVAAGLTMVVGGEGVDRAEQENTAWALASCTDCTTVSVAFHVLLLVGDVEVVTPLNAAVAVNYECTRCLTAAVAVQLVLTLTDLPSAEARALIDQVLADVRTLEPDVATMNPLLVDALLEEAAGEVVRILTEDQVLAGAAVAPPTDEPGEQVAPTESAATEPSTGPTAGSTAGSTAEPGASDEAEPTGEPGPGTTTDPTTPTADPSPTAAHTPTAGTSPSPTAEPDATPTDAETTAVPAP